jgi:hypothetical protein
MPVSSADAVPLATASSPAARKTLQEGLRDMAWPLVPSRVATGSREAATSIIRLNPYQTVAGLPGG